VNKWRLKLKKENVAMKSKNISKKRNGWLSKWYQLLSIENGGESGRLAKWLAAKIIENGEKMWRNTLIMAAK